MTSSNMPTYEDPSSGSDSLDFRKVVSMLLARAWIIVVCLILSGGVTFLYLYRAVPRYTATAVLVYQIDQLRPMDMSGLLPENTPAQLLESRLRPISRELQSPRFLQKVAEIKKLAEDPRFLPPTPDRLPTVEDAALRLGKLLTVEVPRNDNVIFVTVEHPDPNVAADLANSVARQFILQKDADRGEALDQARLKLQDVMTSLRTDWEAMEREMEPLRETADDLSRALVFQTEMINQLAQERMQLNSRMLALESSSKQIDESQGDLTRLLGIVTIATDNDVRVYRQAIVERELALTRLKQQYKEKHPLYIQGENDLKAAQINLAKSVNDAVLSVRSALETMRKQEADIQAKFEANRRAWDANFKQMQASTNAMNSGEVELQRTILDRVMQRVKEATISADLFNNPLKVEEEAIVPFSPSKPNKIKVAALGVFAGIACGVGLALALGFVDTSLKSLEETEQFLNFPVLSAVPRLPELEAETSQIIMNDEANFAGAEAFRSLRTSISVLHKGKTFKTILFTSALPEEGKTFCALNYAVALAQQGQRTLLIECDLRRPMVAPALSGVREDYPGVTDYLRLSPSLPAAPVGNVPDSGDGGLSFAELRRKHAEGSSGASAPATAATEVRAEVANRPTLDEFVQKTTIENLTFLSAGAPAMDAAELLAQSNAVVSLITEAQRKFDRIVIDSAPLLGVSESLLLATQVQAVCLVIRAHRTARNTVQRALEMLQRADAPVLGIILNGLVATRSDYYSDYYHYEDYRAKARNS
ncbi:MAG: AAA family ATPase [Verrucomicrobia bacterium]|nr:AAA family ATPase [Verrucomicrobiota bacterium]